MGAAAPRAGMQWQLRRSGAFLPGWGRTAPPGYRGPHPEHGPGSVGAPASSPAQSHRTLSPSLSAGESAKPRPPFCPSGRSGRNKGTGPGIFSLSLRQAPQASKGHKGCLAQLPGSARPR
ncbi:hypothetical protein NDU88_005653 [Pleurodeles waltl]|uniref:Uncharacterized protein n=1 Tax=Pleurodeles waltl TaxID=8319 RepID=A0AAV7UMQ5_PLEWA|nr:hypothetical protein NDU88_005653 [Pleurodeles waltl]